MKPKETIERFDRFLDAEGLRLEAVVIGGIAMALLGVTSRQTKDCDVLVPTVPPEIADALPPGWRRRLRPLFEGQALRLLTLGRVDLLRSKLFALCDRALDLQDCLALQPTEQELDEVMPWLVVQDANSDWPEHVRATIEALRRKLDHGV